MRELEKPVARVFRRLRYQRFLAALVWSWAIALAIVAGVIGGEKLLNRRFRGRIGCRSRWPAGVGLLVAAVIRDRSPARAGWTPRSRLDRVFHLNERVSSALIAAARTCARRRPGEALIADADPEGHRPGRRRRVRAADPAPGLGRPDPGDRRPYCSCSPPRWCRRIVQAKTTDSRSIPRRSPSRPRSSPRKSPASGRRSTRRSSPRPTSCWPQIEKKTDDLAKAPPAGKDKLMVELNALTDALKERQKQLGSPEQVNRQLQQLKEMGSQGPADEFAKDLARATSRRRPSSSRSSRRSWRRAR